MQVNLFEILLIKLAVIDKPKKVPALNSKYRVAIICYDLSVYEESAIE